MISKTILFSSSPNRNQNEIKTQDHWNYH